MKTVIIVLSLLIILVLITRRSPSVTKTTACPMGYMPSPVNSTWAGWQYNCLPDGIESSLVGIPSDTYVRPITTIYAPMISATGRAQSLMMGTPARTLEFPPQHDRGLFPPSK
jgi:hypothetical protein